MAMIQIIIIFVVILWDNCWSHETCHGYECSTRHLVMRGIPAIPQSAPQFATPWTTMVALMLRSLWLVRNDNSFKQVCLTSELVWARFKTEHLNTLKAVCRKSSLSTALRNSCKRTWGNRNRLINFPPTGRPLIGEINRLLSFSPQHSV